MLLQPNHQIPQKQPTEFQMVPPSELNIKSSISNKRAFGETIEFIGLHFELSDQSLWKQNIQK